MYILYVTNKDPRKINGGNEQRTNLLWNSLKNKGKVFTLVHDNSLNSEIEFIDEDHPILLFRQESGSKHNFWYGLYWLMTKLSGICIFQHRLSKGRLPIDRFGVDKFDIVITRYISPLCKWKLWKYADTYVDIDDYPLQVYDTLIKKNLPLLLRPVGHLLTEIQTKYLLKKTKGGWIANKEQLKPLGKNFEYLPNLASLPASMYNALDQDRRYLFTIGNMRYKPNYEGVDKFLRDIWPCFHKQYKDVKYVIGGKGAPSELANKWNRIEGVEYVGFIEDLASAYQHCIATVVPVYNGGGTCIKTLESLSHSRLCISTAFGARGLVPSEKNGILLYSDLSTFCNSFKKALIVSIRSEIEKNGHTYILKHFSPEVFNESVNSVINQNNGKS